MYNQEIKEYFKSLTEQSKNNLKKLIEYFNEYTRYIDNYFNCLNAFFENSENNNCNSLVVNNGEDEMTITRRSDGRYVKTITINNNKKYFYGNTKEECRKKYSKFLKQCKNKLIESNTKITIKDWLNKWYETFKVNFVSEQTAKEIKNIIDDKLIYFHKYKIQDINTILLQNYFNKIQKSRPKEKTILYFRASLEKAQQLGYIKSNPFNAFIKEKKINIIKPPFTLEEQRRILERLENEKIKPAILIYLITGLRKQELNYKSIEKDIDYENKTLKAINLKQREEEPRYKTIDLTEKAIELIHNNIKDIHELTHEKVYRRFNQILKELKIKGDIHTLRHTFATNCMYLGIPTKIYSKWLGHSTTQITQDIYTGIDKNITKEKINKLYNNLYINF